MMALMIVDFGNGEISEIVIPEIHNDDVTNELRQMSAWLNEVAQDATEYLSITEQLEKSDWVKNDENRHLLTTSDDNSLELMDIPFDGHIKEFDTWIKQPGVMARLPNHTASLFDSSDGSETSSEALDTAEFNEYVKEYFANLTQSIIRERDSIPPQAKQQQLSALKKDILALSIKTSESIAEFITHDRAFSEVYRSASTHRIFQSNVGTLLAPSLQPVLLEEAIVDSSYAETNQAIKLYPEISARREHMGRATYRDNPRRTAGIGMTR